MKLICQVTKEEVSVNNPQIKNTADLFGLDVNTLKQNYVGRLGRNKLRILTIPEAKQKHPNVLDCYLEKYCGTQKKASIADLL